MCACVCVFNFLSFNCKFWLLFLLTTELAVANYTFEALIFLLHNDTHHYRYKFEESANQVKREALNLKGWQKEYHQRRSYSLFALERCQISRGAAADL